MAWCQLNLTLHRPETFALPIIPEALLLAHLAACASGNPAIATLPADFAVRVAAHESGGQQYAINVNRDVARGLPAVSVKPQSLGEAAALVTRYLKEGRSIDAGPWQVNSQHWARLGLDPASTLFDVRANTCAGAGILADGWSREMAVVTRRTLCRYNTGRPECTNGYPEAVARVGRIAASLPSPPDTEPLPLPPPPPPGEGTREAAAPSACAGVPRWAAWERARCLEAAAGAASNRAVRGPALASAETTHPTPETAP